MGCLALIAALASGVNSVKRCRKHCHPFTSIEGVNITAHVATTWTKILEKSEIQPCNNLTLWSNWDFTSGLCADLNQISSSWQLQPGPHPAAKQIPLKPRHVKSYWHIAQKRAVAGKAVCESGLAQSSTKRQTGFNPLLCS